MSLPPPQWLQTLANDVAEQILSVDMLAPLGCHFAYMEPEWEVTLFAATTEVVGGVKDGVVRPPRFACDVKAIMNLFDAVERIGWQSMPVNLDDDLGAHLSIEGTYQGQAVWLRILARPPRHFESGRVARVHDRVWEEVW